MLLLAGAYSLVAGGKPAAPKAEPVKK